MPRLSSNSNKSTEQVVRWAENLAQLVKETQMSELRLEFGSRCLRMRRHGEADGGVPAIAAEPAAQRPAPRPETTSPNEDFGTPVSSRFVGVFRSSHPKTGKAMVSTGDTTETNQVLGWVECMGIRHEVVAPRAGTVAEVLVDDAEPVEFGQVLLVIQ